MTLNAATRRTLRGPKTLVVGLAAIILAGLLAVMFFDALAQRRLSSAAEAGLQIALLPRATRAEVQRAVTRRLGAHEEHLIAPQIDLLVNGHLPRETPWLEIHSGDEVRLTLRPAKSAFGGLLGNSPAVTVVRRKL